MMRTSRRTCLSILLAACAGWGAIPVGAQAPARGGNVDSVETSAMTCWWDTDTRAVRVGQPFGLALTCRVMETDRVKVVPNLTEVEPTSIELTPFEVLEGTRHEDIVVGPWRYVQYQYTLRLLGEEFFGRDIAIPATNVTFRIQTGGADAVEGTEHRYVLPSMPMRILSLLPAQAADIRDPAVDAFGDLEARRFRATMELAASAIFLGFAAVAAIVAGLRVRERFRKGDVVVEQTVPERTVLDARALYLTHARGRLARRLDVESRGPGACTVPRRRRHRPEAAGRPDAGDRRCANPRGPGGAAARTAAKTTRPRVCVDHGRGDGSPANGRQRSCPGPRQ